jgi:hypothetical protein
VTAGTSLSRAPLVASLDRLANLPSWVQLHAGLPADQPGWVRCADLLADPDGFDRWRAGLAGWLVEQHGAAPDRTTAGYVLTWYLSAPGFLAGLLFHSVRRVPSLRPADLALRLPARGRPHPVAVALLADGFACLPDDPDRDHPAATVVADETALAALLRARYTAHAAQFVAVYRRTVRLGARTLWAAATDALDNGVWLAGRLLGDEPGAVADAALLLSGDPTPLTAGSTLRPAPGGGWTRTRQGCCFHYALPGAAACATCPRNRPC